VARIPETFDFGSNEMNIEELVVKLQRMYMDLAEAVNSKPDLYERQTDGLTSDTFLSQGSININLLTDKVEMLTNHTSATTVTWTQI
jgi:hypothetical protein